jgi:two-component system LytT family sensor kinase
VKPVSDSLIFITLLVELGVAAAVSSSLARSKTFRDLLLLRVRSFQENAKLVSIFVAPLVLGVWIRVRVPNFLAADISFEAIILLGLLLGPLSAMAAGAALAIPALWHGEYWTLPVNLGVAAVAGAFARFANPDDVWSFSPLIDLSIYRWVTRNLKRPQFELHSNTWYVELAICIVSPIVVGIPLKIWNQIRIERKLEEQSRLLLEARLDALQRQINPHFLFNTLNSITSLVRSKPELAREMIVKLANILRVLLKDRDAFVPFADELAFTDDYLDIEVVRFGEKLRVVKEIAPETLGVVVPSMLLQPLIENSIKHGLEPRIEGGTVTLRSRMMEDGRMLVEVEDDGVGMAPGRAHAGEIVRPGTGIGMRNVRERMEVLYGQGAEVKMESRPGRGTKVALHIPVLEGTTLDWGKLREAVEGVMKGLGR